MPDRSLATTDLGLGGRRAQPDLRSGAFGRRSACKPALAPIASACFVHAGTLRGAFIEISLFTIVELIETASTLAGRWSAGRRGM